MKSTPDTVDVSRDVTASLPGAGSRVTRLGPIAAGGALLAAGTYVAAVDPSDVGSRYPICSFHQLTGLWCPGCGLTRGAHELLNGDVVSALSLNVFLPIVIVAIVGGWWLWLRRAWHLPAPRWTGSVRRFAPAIVVCVAAFGVLRNVPLSPFSWLAP